MASPERLPVSEQEKNISKIIAPAGINAVLGESFQTAAFPVVCETRFYPAMAMGGIEEERSIMDAAGRE